jgi:hypothetical protein
MWLAMCSWVRCRCPPTSIPVIVVVSVYPCFSIGTELSLYIYALLFRVFRSMKGVHA